MHKIIRLFVPSFFLVLGACSQAVSDEGAEEPRIEPAEIQGAMRGQYFEHAKSCYETLLAEDADAAGKIVMRFRIIEGAATDVTAEPAEGNLDQADFKACMTAALDEVTFPVADGDVTVSYPIAFSDD